MELDQALDVDHGALTIKKVPRPKGGDKIHEVP